MLWCIRNAAGEYWSNEWGWGTKKGCDTFVSRDWNLPIGGRWARYH